MDRGSRHRLLKIMAVGCVIFGAVWAAQVLSTHQPLPTESTLTTGIHQDALNMARAAIDGNDSRSQRLYAY